MLSNENESVIKFDNVTKIYDHGVEALSDINIDIKKGEFVFLVGPSGSGKSTFLKLLVKEEDVTNGNIYLKNTKVNILKRKEVPFLRRKVGFVFQDFRLLYDKTVEKNIEFALRVVGINKSQINKIVEDSLKLVGLEGKEKKYPNQLSGGEQQRVALARALATNPSILIADEPTGNLDPATANEIFSTLLKINKMGTTILVVTHAKDIVNNLNKRVITLNKGKVIKDEVGGYTI